jgi:serine/threonine protein kinase
VRTLCVLHASDIIWGDFKPNNMLIDNDDNVCIIDFGGGRTEGYVDFDNMHTREGNLQGLARLKKFLDLK